MGELCPVHHTYRSVNQKGSCDPLYQMLLRGREVLTELFSSYPVREEWHLLLLILLFLWSDKVRMQIDRVHSGYLTQCILKVVCTQPFPRVLREKEGLKF